jgi:hypothetical protein
MMRSNTKRLQSICSTGNSGVRLERPSAVHWMVASGNNHEAKGKSNIIKMAITPANM